MIFTYINSAWVWVTNSTVTCNKPTNTADWDIMFAVINTYTNWANYYIDAVPAWWTEIARQDETATYQKYYLYYKVASSEWANYTWETDNSTNIRVTISSYRWAFNTSDPIDAVSSTQYITNNSTIRAASFNVAAVNSPLVFIGCERNQSSASFTRPSTNPDSSRIEDFYWWETTSDFWNTFCSMVWDGSWATGTIDATSANTTTQKHAFAVSLNPSNSQLRNRVGLYAINRLSAFNNTDTTFISRNYPSNFTWVIDTIEVRASSNMTWFKVATFTLDSWTTYIARDVVTIWDVTAWSKQTFTWLSLNIAEWDYIWWIKSTWWIEMSTSWFYGLLIKAWDYTDDTAEYTLSSAVYGVSLYWYSTALPASTAQAWFLYLMV